MEILKNQESSSNRARTHIDVCFCVCVHVWFECVCVCVCVCVYVALGFISALFRLYLLCKACCATCYLYEKCNINKVRLIDMRRASCVQWVALWI